MDKKRAIILDRDGTINEDVGDFCALEKLVFIPGAIAALKRLQKDYLLFVVTNQEGISKGIFTQKEVERFHKHYAACLKKEGVEIKAFYYCPHTRGDNCACRKPSPFFL